MENEVLVKVEGLSKKFCKDFKRSLWFGAKDIAAEIAGLERKKTLRKNEFWAVKDVSFEIRRGECLGLIGHNGAGKSTLLKMLNGLINPDEGTITMKGRIGALIELGSGFNPVLTGRENVFNNGVLYGFTHKEILAKYKDIVEFAELEEFMDTPVQNYSSGMKVRLGFAVAAQMEPDVLIIDEVLAVGDVNFKIKCFNVIGNLLKNCSVIIVSHHINHIARICHSLIYLEKGIGHDYSDKVDEGIQRYLEIKKSANPSNSVINDVSLLRNEIQKEGNNIEIDVALSSDKWQGEFVIDFKVFDAEMKLVAIINSYFQRKVYEFIPGGITTCLLSFNNPFPNGRYSINISILELEEATSKSKNPIAVFENAMLIVIKEDSVSSAAHMRIKAIWHD